MSIDIDDRKRSHSLHTRKSGEMTLSPEQIEALKIATEAEAAEREMQLGEMSSPLSYFTDKLSEDKLREKIEKLKKDFDALEKQIEAMERQNEKQEEKIRDLESSQDKLQKELEKVKTEKVQLRIEVEALTKKLENVEKENKELKRRLEKMSASNTSLKQDIDLMREENQQLKDDMGNLKTGHQVMREDNQQLRDEVKALKTENRVNSEKFECKKTRLALGQVAWLLEAEIWKAVLPDQKMGYTGILNSMNRWLNKNSKTPKGKAAQKRWDELQEELKWVEDDHNYALKCLKDLRVEDAHPKNVDLEEVRKQLNEGAYIADVDKKVCEDIIDMVVTARKLNSS